MICYIFNIRQPFFTQRCLLNSLQTKLVKKLLIIICLNLLFLVSLYCCFSEDDTAFIQ
jgi:hypothetical protein